MAGETELEVLIRTMEPVLSAGSYGYVSLPKGQEVPNGCAPFALVQEEEGLTVIAPFDLLAAHGIPSQTEWARISLAVHSSLSAVGLTAAFARALGREGISANVVAGYYHDHIFVAWADRHTALAALQALACTGGQHD